MATLTTSAPVEINSDPEETLLAPAIAVTMIAHTAPAAKVIPLAQATTAQAIPTTSALVVTNSAPAMIRMILETLETLETLD